MSQATEARQGKAKFPTCEERLLSAKESDVTEITELRWRC